MSFFSRGEKYKVTSQHVTDSLPQREAFGLSSQPKNEADSGSDISASARDVASDAQALSAYTPITCDSPVPAVVPAVAASAEPSVELAPAGAETDRDPLTGHFIAGNVAALVHGGRSRQASALQAPAREAMRRRVLEDLGFADDALSATFSALVDRWTEATQLTAAYFAALEQAGGPISTRGRQRAAVRGYLAALDVEVKLAGLIGLKRTRSLGAPSTPDALLAEIFSHDTKRSHV